MLVIEIQRPEVNIKPKKQDKNGGKTNLKRSIVKKGQKSDVMVK